MFEQKSRIITLDNLKGLDKPLIMKESNKIGITVEGKKVLDRIDRINNYLNNLRSRKNKFDKVNIITDQELPWI